jgi:Protein of unknown function (DUF4231)
VTQSTSSSSSPSNLQFDYKLGRLQEQIDWHSGMARHNKRRYRMSEMIIIFIGAIIPVVNVLDFADLQTRIISSILGATIAIVTGLTQLEKFQENWIIYRTTTELLKKEKYFYENEVGDYSDLDVSKRKKLLVERVESMVSSETSKYFIVHQAKQNENHQQKEN